MNRCRSIEFCIIGFALFSVLDLGPVARADVFHMGPGLTSLEFVTVGNPGNAPDTRYNSTGFGSVASVYKIGKYETTAGQYTGFLNAVAKADPNGLYSTLMSGTLNAGANIVRSGASPNFSYSVAADWANRPVNYVSFWDAARFANWLHNGQPTGPQGPATTEAGAYHDIGNQALFGRNPGAKFFIPSEDEWYKAAYHNASAGLAASYFDYPTGSNTALINKLPDPGNHANFFVYYVTLSDGYTIGGPYYRTNVGDFVNSPSPYGTFDQGGNVWEWNETSLITSDRGFRGGSFEYESVDLLASSRHYYIPTVENTNMGFRVASLVPEPGGITLCIVGAMTLVLWRRVRR
jgi:formylglycine-generating enzyme